MNCSLPGSFIHGIFQARVLEWVAIFFSKGSSQPRDRTWVSQIAGRCFTIWATREAQMKLRKPFLNQIIISWSHVWNNWCNIRLIILELFLFLALLLYLLWSWNKRIWVTGLRNLSYLASDISRKVIFRIKDDCLWIPNVYIEIPLAFDLTKLYRNVCYLVLDSTFIQRRQWHPTPVLVPGKSNRQWSLAGCNPWGC